MGDEGGQGKTDCERTDERGRTDRWGEGEMKGGEERWRGQDRRWEEERRRGEGKADDALLRLSGWQLDFSWRQRVADLSVT